MKKRTVQFLGLIEIIILIGALTLFTLQNPNTLILFLNYATKQLDLSYSEVRGNLLKTIQVKNISYKGKLLTEEAVIDWDLKALLTASLKIDEISIKKLNIPVTQLWIEDLREKFHHEKESSSKITEIPTIEVSEIFFSALPFSNDNIKVERIELFAKKIRGDLSHINIGFFSFLTESNYANITALGKLEENTLSFEKLWLEKIDIQKIRKQFKATKKTQNTTAKKSPAIKQKFIKEIFADNMIIYIKPLHQGHYQIDQSIVAIRKLRTEDLKHFNADKVFIDAVTNMWKLSSEGKLENNTLITKVDLSLIDKYFKRFVPFFNHNAIKPITIDLKVNKKGLSGHLTTRAGTAFLIKKYRDINLSIPKLDGYVDFDFQTLLMKGDINATVRSKYTPKSKVNGHIYFDKHFFYDGNISIPAVNVLPQPLISMLRNSNISFHGNTKKIEAFLQSDHLTAHYDGADYIHTNLHIETKALKLKNIFDKIPPSLHEATASFKGNIPVNFKKFMPLKPHFTVYSNLFDINATATISKKTDLKLHLTQTKDSLLHKLLPKLREKNLFPAQVQLSYHEQKSTINIQNRFTQILINQDFNTGKTAATLNEQPHKLSLSGDIAKDCNITFQTPSLREFQDFVQNFYRFKKLPMDGDIKLDATMKNLNNIDTKLKGKWFVYEYKPNKFLFGEKIRINASWFNNRLTLKNYIFNTFLDRDRIFFANKASSAIFTQKQMKIEHFYINDLALFYGKYNYKTAKGLFHLKTKNYHYNDIEGNIYFDANLDIELSKENNDIEGEVVLNRGTITYAPRKEHYVQDEDIIILQDQKVVVKEKDTLSLDISLLTKSPIYYKIPNTEAKLELDLKFWKEINKELELLGMVKILSGTHTQGGKEFELEPGEILFGGSMLNPYLNIRAIHRSDPYTIYVNINGQLDAPIINFSSTPYLNQSDILSLLLFSSTTNELMSGEQDTSKTAISMFGSVFAKEIVQNFGIKLDKLVLTTTEEGKLGVELGKKLSKKVTLIYINDIIQTIKVRYKLSDHFESDFIFSPDNSGIDIIYKDEY